MALKGGQVQVKISENAARLAKAAAALKGITVPEYISALVEPQARKDLAALQSQGGQDGVSAAKGKRRHS